MSEPPLAKSYPANVLVVILALFPGLINTAAIGLLTPSIARALRVPPGQIGIVPLLSDAALAFGCIVAAEVVRRNDGRIVFWWLMGLLIASSVASALAPAVTTLVASEIVHGLVGGMLFVTVLPPLLLTFGSAKIRSTATVLVPSLFGAATIGPLAAAVASGAQHWRLLFAAEAAIGVLAVALAMRTLAPRPQTTDVPVDWFALTTGAVGSVLICLGAGQLASHAWSDPSAVVPVAAGGLVLLAMLVGEYRNAHGLVPIKPLLSSLALIGAIATIAGSVCFTASLHAMQLTLERVEGFTPHQTGLVFWPLVLAAFGSGVLYGRLVTSKWVPLVGIAGLVISCAAALLAMLRAPMSPVTIGSLSILVGLGAGLSVTPGLFLVALAFERSIVARTIALLEFLRLDAGFISAPGVEHTLGSIAGGSRMVREFVAGAQPAGPAQSALVAEVGAAVRGTFGTIAAIAAVGIVLSAGVFWSARVRLRAPDLHAFDDGKPALESPEVPLLEQATH